ncbi:MAG TPA: basic secretory protein-like protein [Planctomycetota bacterium]|jgi:hypothetical protein|nr:basic secretory protein-like protein [Planctomycetota bacterium]
MGILGTVVVSLLAQSTITVDYSDVPDVKEWAEKARALCEKWYPVLSETLASKDFTPPREVRLVFKDEKKGIAYTSGAKITVVADWIRKHPDDFGMVIHELCHVVQSYPKGVGWITEGIADYVRYFKYEPKPSPPKISAKASYKDGYKTSATFLAWIEKAKDKEIVRKLNEVMRSGGYKDELFKEWTGSDLDTLWKEFLGSQG